MSAKPILMSGAMIRATLEGRKTVTRRVMKPQPHLGRIGNGEVIGQHPGMLGDQYHVWTPKPGVNIPLTTNTEYVWKRLCPYGQPGDLLWVRETWHPVMEGHPVALYRADDQIVYHDTGRRDRNLIYEQPAKWRPSIFMPRCASRITLRITDVRVERVQEITLGDVRAEGIDAAAWQKGDTEFAMFADLWDSLNAKRGHPWSANPWVWVVEFQPILENVDDVLAREAA